ncbi:hypothetical protein HG537_0G00730 [Torulaspora globosa]|uniref:G-patch domain-containing protein n=1 Tax=Torulaspora globosa TaxID=48254 RepID=A0A7H9HX44_9SACH|nr:hypothetical protein HG537_0G00730 [Torulaspora sp. CBS 2947]
MDSKEYLISYGWKEGEALRKGGLKRPILVKHKKDKKGLGCAPGHDDSEAWWERLFDGQLKNLDVSGKSGEIEFKQNESVATGVSKSSSPLYRWFVKGEGLEGTIGHTPNSADSAVVAKRKRRGSDGELKAKRAKKEKKKEKKEKKERKRLKREKKLKKKAKLLREKEIVSTS